MAKAPEGAPNLTPEEVMNAPTITDDMEAEQQGGVHAMKYTEAQVNAFLQSAIKGKDKDATIRFERAYVHFEEGFCRITTQESIFGLSLYATTMRAVSVQNGAIVSRSLGGSFGRLSISSAIMPYLENAFAPLWTVLDHDRKLVSQMQSITFHKGLVEMVTQAKPTAQ